MLLFPCLFYCLVVVSGRGVEVEVCFVVISLSFLVFQSELYISFLPTPPSLPPSFPPSLPPFLIPFHQHQHQQEDLFFYSSLHSTGTGEQSSSLPPLLPPSLPPSLPPFPSHNMSCHYSTSHPESSWMCEQRTARRTISPHLGRMERGEGREEGGREGRRGSETERTGERRRTADKKEGRKRREGGREGGREEPVNKHTIAAHTFLDCLPLLLLLLPPPLLLLLLLGVQRLIAWQGHAHYPQG